MKKLLFTGFIILMTTCATVSMTYDNSTVSANTTYRIIIQRTNATTIAANSTIIFAFNSNNYDLTQLTNATCSPTCTISGRNITFQSSLFSSSPSLLKFNVSGVVNPPSTMPPSYTYTLLSNSSVSLESQLVMPSAFVAGIFKSCAYTFTPNFVGNAASINFTVLPGSPVPVGGYLMVRFPSQWTNTVDNSIVLSTSNLSCTSNSSSLSTLSCSVLLTGMVTVNSFTAKTSSSYSILMSSILAPPTNSPESTVFISSFDSQTFSVDNQTLCTMSPPNPNLLTITNSVSATVSTTFTPIFKFTATDKIAIGDILKVAVVSSDIGISNVSILTIRMVDLFGIVSNGSAGMNSDQSDATQKVYGYSMPKLGSTSPTSKNVELQLTGLSFTASPTTKTIDAFKITLYRNNSPYCTGTTTLTPLPNSLSNITISADILTVSTNTSYNISFKTSSPLTSVGYVQVILPYGLTSTNFTNQSCAAYIGNVSSSGLCSVANGTLVVRGLFTGMVAANTTVIVRLAGVTNPTSQRPTAVFTVSTYYNSSSTDATDQGTGTFTATAATITNCSVTRNVDTVGSSAIYTITYIVKSILPAASNIVIVLPTDISTFSNTTVTISSNNSVSSAKNATITSQQINITSPYFQSVASGTILKIIVTSLRNPNSTKQTSSFEVYAYDVNYVVEKIVSAVIVGPATVGGFLQAAIAVSNTMNGQNTNYTLTFSGSVNYVIGTVLKLSVPTQIIIPTNISCLPSQGFSTNITSLVCTITNTSILITLPQQTNSSITYKITINNLTNPRTFSQSGSFTLVSMTDNLTSSIDSSSIVGVKNTLPNYILNFTMGVASPSQSYMNSNQTILFSVTTKNALIATDYIELTYPTKYTYIGSSNKSICIESNFSCFPNANNQLKISISSSAFNNTKSFTFQLTSYQSPSTLTSDSFLLSTFDSLKQSIDQTNTSNTYSQVAFTPTCTGTCETCNTSNLSYCLTCYKIALSTFIYLQNNTCVSVCNDGMYGNTTRQACVECVAPCKTCVDSLECTSCLNTATNANKSYDSTSKRCVSVCPNGTFSNLSNSLYICSTCNTSCLTCSALSTNCTSCSSIYFLSNFSCVVTCPSGTVGISYVCQPCDVSCLTCSGNTTTCILCATNYSWSASSRTCTNHCGSLVAYNGQCQCDGTCLTCSVLIQNCTSCNTNISQYANYFYNNSVGKCLQNCPSLTYLANGTCVLCSDGCLYCTNSTYCLTCLGDYSLLSNTCVKSCGDGLFSSNNICYNCSNSCKTCAVVSLKCTSCTSPLVLQGTECLTNCTIGIPITLNSSTTCTLCSSTCQTCSIAIDNCTSCSSGQYLLSNKCYVTCPNTTVPNGTICSNCLSPCLTCSVTASQCTSCTTNYLFQISKCVSNCEDGYFKYGSNCLTQCPQNTIALNKQCTSIVDSSNTISSEKVVPIPFTLAAVVAIVIVGVAKIVSVQTNIAAMAVALLSVIEILSWIVTVSLAAANMHTTRGHQAIIIIAMALGVQLVCNIIAFGLYYFYIRNDEDYCKWYKRYGTVCGRVVLGFFSGINHNFFNIIFSRAFGSDYFKASLENPAVFTPLLICTGLSIIPAVLAIVGAALTVSESTSLSSLFMISIDCMIVSGLSILLTAWSLHKPQGFFNSGPVKKYTANEEVNYQSHYNQTMEDINDQAEEVGLGCIPIRIQINNKKQDHQPTANEKLPNRNIKEPEDWENPGQQIGQDAINIHVKDSPVKYGQQQKNIEQSEIQQSPRKEDIEQIQLKMQSLVRFAGESPLEYQKRMSDRQNLESANEKGMQSPREGSIVNKILTGSCVKEFENTNQDISQISNLQRIRSQNSSINNSRLKSISKSVEKSYHLERTDNEINHYIKPNTQQVQVKDTHENQSEFEILGQSLERTTHHLQSQKQQDNGPQRHIDQHQITDYVQDMLAMPSFRTAQRSGQMGQLTRTQKLEMAGHIVKNSSVLLDSSTEGFKKLDRIEKLPDKPFITTYQNNGKNYPRSRSNHLSPHKESSSQEFWQCDNWGIYLGPLSPKKENLSTQLEPEHPNTTVLQHQHLEQSPKNPVNIYTQQQDILSHINYEGMINNRRPNHQSPSQLNNIPQISRNQLQLSAKSKALQKIYLQRPNSKKRNRSQMNRSRQDT